MRISLITPAFNEASNLPVLYERVAAAMAAHGLEWEWFIVDDHSADETFDVIRQLAARDPRVRGVRFSRNSGSHTAIACGLHHVRGDAALVLAGDLQDPPETFGRLLERWREGSQVVWAVRRQRAGETRRALGFSRLYYFIMRHVVGMKEMPASGADFFLLDRAVIDAFRRFPERNVTIFGLITWMGFRQSSIEYDKQARHSGRSGWTLAKKIRLVIDSVTAFSEAPIRFCAYLGAGLLGLSLLVALAGLAMLPSLGGGLLLVLAAFVGLSGLQLVALGIVGEYVWRALDESRRRPAYLIEAMAGQLEPVAPVHD